MAGGEISRLSLLRDHSCSKGKMRTRTGGRRNKSRLVDFLCVVTRLCACVHPVTSCRSPRSAGAPRSRSCPWHHNSAQFKRCVCQANLRLPCCFSRVEMSVCMRGRACACFLIDFLFLSFSLSLFLSFSLSLFLSFSLSLFLFLSFCLCLSMELQLCSRGYSIAHIPLPLGCVWFLLHSTYNRAHRSPS